MNSHREVGKKRKKKKIHLKDIYFLKFMPCIIFGKAVQRVKLESLTD